MTGTDVARFTHKQFRSYLNHLVHRCLNKVPVIVVRFYPNLDYHQIFVEATKIKRHENLSISSRAGTLGQTDGDMRQR